MAEDKVAEWYTQRQKYLEECKITALNQAAEQFTRLPPPPTQQLVAAAETIYQFLIKDLKP